MCTSLSLQSVFPGIGLQGKLDLLLIDAGDRSGGRYPAGPSVGYDWGVGGLELEDCRRPDVRALLNGGALRDGLECSGGGKGGGGGGGGGGMGPTRV